MTDEVRAKLTADLESLDRDAKIVIYVLGILERLAKRGMIDAGRVRLTAHSVGAFEVLEEQRFQPTDAEMQWGMNVIQAKCRGEI